MGKYVVVLVVLLMVGAALASTLRVEQVEANPLVALVFPPEKQPVPAYVEDIGKAPGVNLPEANYKAWFATNADPGGEEPDEERDRLDPVVWGEVAAFTAEAKSEAGWSEACAAAGGAVTLDRVDEPLLGALGCSQDPSVTRVQQFALQLLDTRAHLALWVRGAPGYAIANVQARQAEVRLQCAVEVVAREGGEASPYAAACALAMDIAYLDGNGTATFDALGEAYALVAAEIARRALEIDVQPAFFSVDP